MIDENYVKNLIESGAIEELYEASMEMRGVSLVAYQAIKEDEKSPEAAIDGFVKNYLPIVKAVNKKLHSAISKVLNIPVALSIEERIENSLSCICCGRSISENEGIDFGGKCYCRPCFDELE